MELDWPLVSLEPFLFVARAALERLVQRMECRGLGCRRLEVSMELEPDGHHVRSIALPAPTRDIKTLLKLVQLDLEAHQPGAPVASFVLTAHPDRPRSAQLSLFGPEALSPDKLATTLARLFSILGEDRVGSPRVEDCHRPEGVVLAPYEPPPPPKTRREVPKGRDLLGLRVVRPALPVEVLTESQRADAASENAERTAECEPPIAVAYERSRRPCDERPISVKSLVNEDATKRPKVNGAVRVASGPWAVEESWWSGEPVERDYWDLELSGGGLYRLYRERNSGDWFVDGIYD